MKGTNAMRDEASVTYRLPGGSVAFISEEESRIRIFLETFWLYPLLFMCFSLGWMPQIIEEMRRSGICGGFRSK